MNLAIEGMSSAKAFMEEINFELGREESHYMNLFCFVFTVNWETVWRPNTTKKFEVHTNMNSNVGLLRIFPGITAAAVSLPIH